MSKRKQLIHDVFEKIQKTSEKDSKNGWSDDLSDEIEKKTKFKISGKTLSRYYDSYIAETKNETGIETLILNKLSQYLDFDDYENFCTTIEKKGEDASKTSIKVDVDNNPLSASNLSGGLTINIDNTNSNTNKNDQHFKMPEFIKQNGMGILEMTLVLFMVTGGVVFSKDKKPVLGIAEIWNNPATEKPYMYWDKDRYIASDSSYINPQIEVVPMEPNKFVYQKKITRPDTLTIENGDHKVWYDKTNNHVEFFTNYGKHPENGKTLKEATGHIIETYGGANATEELADN